MSIQDKQIAAAFEACSTMEPITVAAVTNQLKGTISSQYDGTPFERYKSNWLSLVIKYAQSHSIPCTNIKPDWNSIASIIIDNLVALSDKTIYTATLSKENDCSPPSTASAAPSVAAAAAPSLICPSRPASNSPSVTSSISTAVSPCSEASSDNISMKLRKLIDTDKQNINSMYNNLDQKNLWKLMTGRIVEHVMQQVASSLEHEHPSHSLILDLSDQCWSNAFKPEEWQEIRNYKSIDMPEMPHDVDTYLQKLHDLSSNTLYDKLKKDHFPLDGDLNWIQRCFTEAFRLSRSDFFPLNNRTEGDLLKRVWSVIDTCFDFGAIKCTSGEKCSKASADFGNSKRSISNPYRQNMGRKMDYIFTARKSEYELGCGECGLVAGTNTTEELFDASFKLPLVMKDMAVTLASSHPTVLRDLVLLGFYMGETRLQLKTMDFPCGHVARVDSFNPISFPKTESEISRSLPAVLKLILGGKIIMEMSRLAVEHCKDTIVIGKNGTIPAPILPNFAPAASTKKRRKSQTSSSSQLS